jgi:hypothetical protein
LEQVRALLDILPGCHVPGPAVLRRQFAHEDIVAAASGGRCRPKEAGSSITHSVTQRCTARREWIQGPLTAEVFA